MVGLCVGLTRGAAGCCCAATNVRATASPSPPPPHTLCALFPHTSTSQTRWDCYAGLNSLLLSRDLLRNLRCVAVRYTKYYHKLQGQELLADLFRDEKVQEAFQVGLTVQLWRVNVQ